MTADERARLTFDRTDAESYNLEVSARRPDSETHFAVYGRLRDVGNFVGPIHRPESG